MEGNRLYTVNELSKLFGINPKTAYYRLKAANLEPTRLPDKGKINYYDIGKAKEILIKPLARNPISEEPQTDAPEVQDMAEEFSDEGEVNEEINYTFEPPSEPPNYSGQCLNAEFIAILTEFFGFEGARRVLINNYGLKPWKVA